jgi:hypothetical protein
MDMPKTHPQTILVGHLQSCNRCAELLRNCAEYSASLILAPCVKLFNKSGDPAPHMTAGEKIIRIFA